MAYSEKSKSRKVGIIGMSEKVDLQKAHDELWNELFGSPKQIGAHPVTRSMYTKAMKEVQDKYGLRQGHPQFLEWVFTCIGQSPIIIEDEEGAGSDDNKSTEA